MSGIRATSKLLFGNSIRLEVAAAIAASDPGITHATVLAQKLSLPVNVVREELLRLTEAGLLMRLPRPRGQQHQEYERLPDSYWTFAREYLRELQGQEISDLSL